KISYLDYEALGEDESCEEDFIELLE
ncbi:5-formyltetrahydrofolate cyclo-ligase, partial [Francisella tularensis subsp. holarctica]|nr:5-formyltetrahydrofolate cyclo-ligase [Francisella tularensis subsp. holarctica]